MSSVTSEPVRDAARAVRELRHTRRVRRLGDLEWFEVAYRVYLAALVGGGMVLWASNLVDDAPASAAGLADVREHGPAVVGMLVATAAALGLRSGSDGGPVSLEAPDVRHLLLAPVPRRRVLARPVAQRLRTVAFGGALAGGVAGLLADRRLPGSPTAWAASGAAAGAATGALFVAVAVLAHAGGVPRAAATAVAGAVLGAQAGATAGWWPAGPADTIGSLALWGMRQHEVDLAGAAVVMAAVAGAIAAAGRLRVEPLVRRGDLVSQLRFAVTMQDLRTVVLLRRQLRGEQPRRRPWIASSRSRRTGQSGRAGHPTRLAAVAWRRGWRGLARYPLARLVRMAVLAVGAGAAAVAVLRGTSPAIVGVGGALYLLGLDAVEPLSQEVDHPDHTDAYPHARGTLLAGHLAAPAVAVVPFALLGAATVVAAGAASGAGAAAALALAAPIAWGGVAGAVVSVVRDAPDPLAAPASTAVPPEFAGFTSTIRLLWPLALSTLGALPVLAAREQPTVGTVVRSIAGVVLLASAVVWWVRRRDEWRARWRGFLEAGRASSGARAGGTGGGGG